MFIFRQFSVRGFGLAHCQLVFICVHIRVWSTPAGCKPFSTALLVFFLQQNELVFLQCIKK
jgi:hypothetical protein